MLDGGMKFSNCKLRELLLKAFAHFQLNQCLQKNKRACQKIYGKIYGKNIGKIWKDGKRERERERERAKQNVWWHHLYA